MYTVCILYIVAQRMSYMKDSFRFQSYFLPRPCMIGSPVNMKVGVILALISFSIFTIGDGLKCYQCHDSAFGVKHICKDKAQGKLEECDEGVKHCYLKTATEELGIFLKYFFQEF